MSLFKNSGHLFRFAGLFVLAFLIFLGVRGFVVPKSFGQYGHYRALAIKDDAARPTFYAGHDACEMCHSDIAGKKNAGKHAHVNCEACHGPQAAHAADGSNPPKKPDTEKLCHYCHSKSLARPKGFPQIGPDHSTGLPCETCHNPHSPAMDAAATGGAK